VRNDEQSVMKSGRLFQARGPATANARSSVWCEALQAPAGEMKMMTAVDVVKWLQGQAEWLLDLHWRWTMLTVADENA